MAWWTHCTKTGRVVYDRPTHRFSWCDVRRILRTLGQPRTPFQRVCEIETVEFVAEEASRDYYLGEIVVEENWEGQVTASQAASWLAEAARRWDSESEEFGGGESGGGGASRSYEEDDRTFLEKLIKPFPTD